MIWQICMCINISPSHSLSVIIHIAEFHLWCFWYSGYFKNWLDTHSTKYIYKCMYDDNRLSVFCHPNWNTRKRYYCLLHLIVYCHGIIDIHIACCTPIIKWLQWAAQSLGLITIYLVVMSMMMRSGNNRLSLHSYHHCSYGIVLELNCFDIKILWLFSPMTLLGARMVVSCIYVSH